MATQVNGIDVDVLTQVIKAVQGDPELGYCRFQVTNQWQEGARNLGKVGSYYAAKQDHEHGRTFQAAADEPPLLAGGDTAPNPVEHLLIALASCLTTSIVAHAAVRGIDIQELESHVEGELDLRGFFGLSEDVPKGYQKVRAKFRVRSDATPEQLGEFARFSPVLNTLLEGVDVAVDIEPMSVSEFASPPATQPTGASAHS